MDCARKYEYMPDGSWKGTGTCTRTYKAGDKMYDSWEEGSQLKEYPYKITGGTGKYQGASGGGTYIYENLTDTLSGSRFCTIQLQSVVLAFGAALRATSRLKQKKSRSVRGRSGPAGGRGRRMRP